MTERAVWRGPTNHRCGSSHPKARHGAEVVAEARRLYAAGVGGYKTIGDRLGVPWRTVADWVRYDTRWVDESGAHENAAVVKHSGADTARRMP